MSVFVIENLCVACPKINGSESGLHEQRRRMRFVTILSQAPNFPGGLPLRKRFHGTLQKILGTITYIT